jgi:methylenetetrahydrofolate reductase (NADPH)
MTNSHTEPDVTSRFQKSLRDPGEFTLTFELVPSRGGRSREQSRIISLARQMASDRRIQAVSITENAGGHPALSPEVLGLEIKDMGLDVISHFSCKDKNRNQMESLLFAWDRAGLHNLLVLTGDYPQRGFQGSPKPVFDLDSVQVLQMLSLMNAGRFDGCKSDHPECPFSPTSFCKGVAISPFKMKESEQIMQYFKLHRKAEAGADYAITQLGYDPRKFHELLLYKQQHNIDLPLLGNVFIPNLAVAERMYRGEIPGCIITDKHFEIIQREAKSPDRGKKARLLRGAKLLCILKKIGYNGAHIGGPGLTFADLDFMLAGMEDMLENWADFVDELSFWPDDGYFFYEKDPESGLNLPQAKQEHYRPQYYFVNYEFAKTVHNLAFRENGLLYKIASKICLYLSETGFASFLANFEHIAKFLVFGCQNCGDCTLAELAFLCPQSGCAKYMLNGPCGGSRDGWCEVYPGKKRCLYVKLHERAKKDGITENWRSGYVPPRNWALNNSSSWVNFYSSKDHTGTRSGHD